MTLRLRELRKKNNLSQRKIADVIGCSPATYSRYETGQREPSIDILIQLSSFYNVSVDYIIGNTLIEYSALSDNEIELLHELREAPSYLREDILEFLKLKNTIGSNKKL